MPKVQSKREAADTINLLEIIQSLKQVIAMAENESAKVSAAKILYEIYKDGQIKHEGAKIYDKLLNDDDDDEREETNSELEELS